MARKPGCICKCDSTACECWDGITMEKMEKMERETKENNNG